MNDTEIEKALQGAWRNHCETTQEVKTRDEFEEFEAGFTAGINIGSKQGEFPKCETCEYWDKNSREELGAYCNSKGMSYIGDEILYPKTFGCIFHSELDTELEG